jgi:hypothetical protein
LWLSCRYLGAIPGLVEEFEREAGHLRPKDAHEWVRNWLMQHPGVLAAWGLKPSDLEKGKGDYQLDHILPDSKGGCSHPMNYMIIPASLNQSFSGYITLRKWRYVGPATLLAVIVFHAARLPSASVDVQSLQLAMAAMLVPDFPTLQ